jgi:hypothetical protein
MLQEWASALAAHGSSEPSGGSAIALQKAGGWSNGRMLPEEDAVLLLQLDLGLSSNQQSQVVCGEPGSKQGSWKPRFSHRISVVATLDAASVVAASVCSKW